MPLRRVAPVIAPRAARLAACALAALLCVAPADARDAPPVKDVPLGALPAEAQQTYARIGNGGPFPYERDGVVFGNRERLLPPKSRGYYREYTVTTPGVSHRGARRIVCGGAPRAPDACYYTDDHYQSFRRIRE